ncbi:MAG: riboflavin synthase [Terriglobales bacterium]
MFTGIIQAVGGVAALERRASGARLRLAVPAALLRHLKLGDSVAVNGCCLTVAAKTRGGFAADLSAETLARTTLAAFRPGQRVSLEPALRYGDPLGGHLLQGHVEGTGRFVTFEPGGMLRIEVPAALRRYVVLKGSLAVDGVSLTVATLRGRDIGIALIPHTLRHTHLKTLAAGDRVNLETDPLARHLERLLQRRDARSAAAPPSTTADAPPALTLATLRQQGF